VNSAARDVAIDTGSRTLARLTTRTDTLGVSDAGELTVDSWSVPDLVTEYESPLFILSESVLRANYARVRDAFSRRWPAEVNVMYAIKANNNLAVRAVMASLGAGGDCFSEGEILATVRGGADTRKLALNGSNKSDAALRAAVRIGMTINVDSDHELSRILMLASDLGQQARICVRLRLQSPAFDRYVRDHPGAVDLNEILRRRENGLSVAAAATMLGRARSEPAVIAEGCHFHLGWVSDDPVVYQTWAGVLGAAIVDLHRETGFWPAVVDVGGGLAREREPESGDRSTRNPWTVEDYAAAITSPLLSAFSGVDLPVPQLWLEPGRYIVGNAGVLAARVGGIRQDLGRTWVHVDASVNDLARADTAGWDYDCLPASRMHEPLDISADVVGSLCMGEPLSRSCHLPALGRGDVVAFLDAGMYAEVASTQYNAIPRPATVLTTPDVVDLIKVRETVDDIFAHHRIPERLTTTDAVRIPQ